VRQGRTANYIDLQEARLVVFGEYMWFW
jgi:hypothetical protein